MTQNEILFDYSQAIKQASKLDEIARKLDRLASDKMENTVGSLRSAWQSDSSQQYYNKVGKVQGDMRATAGKIKTIAQSIRTTADAVKRAEQRALEIAQTREYQ